MKFLSIIILVCCSPRESNQPAMVQDIVSRLDVKEIRQINKLAYFFSSLTKKDTFILELRGNYITKSNINFRIISFQNEVIYEEEFDMMALYGFGPDLTKTNPDSITVENHLVKRFDNFFNLKNFVRPAIKESAKYEELYNSIIPEREWRQIKSNPASVGFGFTLWEESISYIVYSKTRKKVIIYQVCC